VPFVVKTSNWTDNQGVTHTPGVYIQNAKIAQASIDNLTVTTSLIAPGAIGLPIIRSFSNVTVTLGAGASESAVSTVGSYLSTEYANGTYIASFEAYADNTAESEGDCFVSVTVSDGVSAQTKKAGVRVTGGAQAYFSIPVSVSISGAGARTFTITAKAVSWNGAANPGSAKSLTLTNCRLVLMGSKR
jgi:hypothetical protein